jgi:hypothetical protein
MATIRSMMWRGVRNWPLMPAVVSLEQQVFVQVALGVSGRQRQFFDHFHSRDQQRFAFDFHVGVAHVFAEIGIGQGDMGEMRKHVGFDMFEHVFAGQARWRKFCQRSNCPSGSSGNSRLKGLPLRTAMRSLLVS